MRCTQRSVCGISSTGRRSCPSSAVRPTMPEQMRIHTGDRCSRYCFDGNLQAVLDEYCHMLKDAGLETASSAVQAETLAGHIHGSASIRTAQNAVHHFDVGRGKAQVDVHNLRSHIAARFGRAATSDEASDREATVREGFNSPFWPFVLASTSVGQEGLDFHTYSHAVVHWNLPSNPVDLEQREGRVHRFKGHAVRRNIADEYGPAAVGEVGDPWRKMFDSAEADRPAGDSLLDPYWVRTGDAAIERYVPGDAAEHGEPPVLVTCCERSAPTALSWVSLGRRSSSATWVRTRSI